MAKIGLGMGGGAPRTTNSGSPGGIMPMPRPQGLGQPAASGAGDGGFFGPKGSEARYDMVMQLLSSAMSSAQGSNSPLLAFLAPLATSAIGARATKIHDDARASEVSQMTEGFLGPNGMNTEAQRALEVLNNPNAPDYLKSIAKTRFDAAMKPASAPHRSGGRAASTGGGTARSGRLMGEYDIGGILHGRTADGRMVPYMGPDGQPVRSGTGNSTGTPSGTNDDPLNLRPSDPLEIR